MPFGNIQTDVVLITEIAVNGMGQIIPQYIWDTIASKLSINPAIVAAAGASQGTATSLTAQFSIVTSQNAGGTGVIVATSAAQTAATYPIFCKIWNALTTTGINVYPPSGAQFGNLGLNVPIQLGAGAAVEVCMVSNVLGYAV